MYQHTNAVYGHIREIPMKNVIVNNMQDTPGGHCSGEMFINNMTGYPMYPGETLTPLVNPVDLSSLNSGDIRDSDSPLDLSVKTRKHHADSTGEFDCLGQPKVKRSHFLSQPLDLRAKDQSARMNDCGSLNARIDIMGKELKRSQVDNSVRCLSSDTRAYQGRNAIFSNNQQIEPGNISKFHPAKDKKQIQHDIDQKEEFFQMIRGMTNVGGSLSNGNQAFLNKNAQLTGIRQGDIPRPQLANQSLYVSTASVPSSFFDMTTTGVLRCSPDSTTMKQSKFVRANVHDAYINRYCSVKPNSRERNRTDLDCNNLKEWFPERPTGLMQNNSISSPTLGSLHRQSSQSQRTYSNPDNQLPGSTIHYKTPKQVCRDKFTTTRVNKLQSREHNFTNTLRQTPSETSSKHAFANCVSLYNIQPSNNIQPHRSITNGTSGLMQQPTKHNCTAESRPKPTTPSQLLGDRYTSSICSTPVSNQSTSCVLSESAPSNCDSRISSPTLEPMNYEMPLSISIPPAQLEGKPQTNGFMRRHPKLAFKKHIFLSSVHKDEDHRTINEKEVIKSCDSKYQTINAGSSIYFARTHGSLSPNPSSPKMPTLSPQYKLPPSLISPLIVEPPKLDRLETDNGGVFKGNVLMPNQNIMNPVAKIRPGLKNTIHLDNSDTNSCSTVFSDDCNFQAQAPDQNDISRITKNNCQSLFTKDKTKCSFITKQLGCSRNIPVANVAPMIHKKLESSENGHSKDIGGKPDDKISNMCCNNLNCVRTSVIQNGQSICSQSDPSDRCDSCRESEIKTEKSCDIKSEMLSNDVDSPIKLSPLMKKILRQRQLSQEHSISKRSIDDDKTDSVSGHVIGCIGVDRTDHLSFEESQHSSCERIMKSRNHRRSLLDEIANSTGFVDESKRMKTQTNDLLSDPLLLSREDRALRRAIIQFEKMETKSDKPTKSPRKNRIITNTKRKADQLRKKARLREDKKKIESRKRMMKKRLKSRRERQKGFVDFKPRILKSRTRMQAAGKRGLAKYDRNAAYDKELTREETRNELRKRARLEQHRTRSSTRSRSRSISLPGVPEIKEDIPPVHEGSWEIQGVSHTSKQTLRSGRSKGGLMLKLSWRPNQNKFSRRVACRRESNRNINIRKDCLRYATLNCPYKKRGGESYSFVRNAGHYLRQNIRKLKARHKAKKVDDIQNKGTQSDYPIVTRSRVKNIGKIPKAKKVKKTKRRFQRFRRPVKTEVIEQFQERNVQEDNVPFIELWTSAEEVSSNIATAFKQDFKKIPVDKKTGETLLHRAARLGYQDLVIKRLESGNNEVNVRDNAGFTPLHESCAHGHLDVARQLIYYGADMNMASLEGIRPIHDAVENNHIEVVRLLLSHGADPKISYAGNTLVKMAKTDVTKRFLQGHIADLNGSTEKDSPWEFHGSSVIMETPGLFGCDLFEDVPSDPEDDSEEMFNDTHLSPIFTTFDLVLQGSLLAEECILLYDILQYLQVSKVYFDRKISGCDFVHSAKIEELLISIPEDLCSLSYIGIDQSVVHVLRKLDLNNLLLMFKNHSNKIGRRSEKQKPCSRKKKDMVEPKDCDSFEDNESFQVKQPDQTLVDYPNKKDTTVDILNKLNDLSQSQGSLDFTLKEGTVPEDCFSSMFLKNQIDQNEQSQLPCENFRPPPDKRLDKSSPLLFTQIGLNQIVKW